MGKMKRGAKASEKAGSKADKQKKKSQEGTDTEDLYSKIYSDATDSDDDHDQEASVTSKSLTKTLTPSKEKLKKVVPALPNEHSDSSSEDEGDNFEFDDEEDEPDVIGEEKTLGEEMQDEDEDEEDETESEEEDETAKTELRRQLKDLSFEELEALKQKMGLKEYNEAMFGRCKSGNKNATGGPRKKKKFERINKHRPKEMSSKARVPKLRQVVAVPKRVRKDPRFEDSCGEYKEELWNEHYGFIRDMQKEEAANLKKKLHTVEDRGKKREIRQFIQRVTDKDKAIAKKQQEAQKSVQDKLENRKRVEEGKQPFYMKKSTQKLVDLVEKYNELKASGGLDKYMKKKRKKNAVRDRKYLKPLKK